MPVGRLLLHRMALFSFRLFGKNLGNLQEFFGQMVHPPPPPLPGKKMPERLCTVTRPTTATTVTSATTPATHPTPNTLTTPTKTTKLCHTTLNTSLYS